MTVLIQGLLGFRNYVTGESTHSLELVCPETGASASVDLDPETHALLARRLDEVTGGQPSVSPPVCWAPVEEHPPPNGGHQLGPAQGELEEIRRNEQEALEQLQQLERRGPRAEISSQSDQPSSPEELLRSVGFFDAVGLVEEIETGTEDDEDDPGELEDDGLEAF